MSRLRGGRGTRPTPDEYAALDALSDALDRAEGKDPDAARATLMRAAKRRGVDASEVERLLDAGQVRVLDLSPERRRHERRDARHAARYGTGKNPKKSRRRG